MARTLKQLAREAIDVQDACNLSGVVHGWSRAMEELFTIVREGFGGTKEINEHPINQLWASKVADLTRIETFGVFTKAYDACKQLAAEEEPTKDTLHPEGL